MLLWPSAVYFSSLCTHLSACSSQTDQTPTNTQRHTLHRCQHHQTCSLNPLLLFIVSWNLFPLIQGQQQVARVKHHLVELLVPSGECRYLRTHRKKMKYLCNISKYHSTHFLNICPNLYQYKTQIFTHVLLYQRDPADCHLFSW